MSLAFSEDLVVPQEDANGQFILDLDGYDGPIDLLLQLARDKKIDLSRLSIAHLADQYVTYIEHVRHVRLEIAADYLVMAAWLTYLKSRLLLPAPVEDEPSAEEQLEALAFQLRRLDAMRQAGATLLERPQKDSHFLPRGTIEDHSIVQHIQYQADLGSLLQTYARICRQNAPVTPYDVPELPLHSVDQALERLSQLLGVLPQWSELMHFLPTGLTRPLLTRSAMAATFGASLELVKRGTIHLRQEAAFTPIYVRGAA
jgi:segregation and condensation protein A